MDSYFRRVVRHLQMLVKYDGKVEYGCDDLDVAVKREAVIEKDCNLQIKRRHQRADSTIV